MPVTTCAWAAAFGLALLAPWLGGAGTAAADVKYLQWEIIEQTCSSGSQSLCTLTQRLKVPGGWLVRSTHTERGVAHHLYGIGSPPPTYATLGGVGVGTGLTFVPDPNHSWQPQ
jgi:hypothetical protein